MSITSNGQNSPKFVYATALSTLQAAGCKTVQIDGHTIALFINEGTVQAIDNRCPHMGFPLDKGTVKDGILTCHWHHARFDLASGGTFDQWADDVRSFPVEVREDEIWVDTALHLDPKAHQRDRLAVGLERDISLVIGKAVLTLMDGDGDADRDPIEPFRVGLEFGTRYRQHGWGQGLTMHVCMMNLLPYLSPEEQPRAIYHGLSAVARDCANNPPRFGIRPLPDATTDFDTLKRWFRQFIEVRDMEGAERCVVSAIRAGADHRQMNDMLFAAVTDHRYIDVGHPADFTNKAFEALDIVGWASAEQVLTSLVSGYAFASRMEESNAWRYPIDLVAILETAFEQLPQALEMGEAARDSGGMGWASRGEMVAVLLGEEPQAIADVLLAALQAGCPAVTLAETVAYTAALRVARFHTSNEFSDWDTALHTFTFSNAIHQALARSTSVELLRGVFDGAMSIYLDRFLNIPAARMPEPNGRVADPDEQLDRLLSLLDQQQQVNQSAQALARYLYGNGAPERLLALLGKLLLREDRDFHTIQSIEAAFKQYSLLSDSTERVHVLVAAIRYLAAHSPTVRAQGQTYQIAHRLHRGDHLFQEDS